MDESVLHNLIDLNPEVPKMTQEIMTNPPKRKLDTSAMDLEEIDSCTYSKGTGNEGMGLGNAGITDERRGSSSGMAIENNNSDPLSQKIYE